MLPDILFPARYPKPRVYFQICVWFVGFPSETKPYHTKPCLKWTFGIRTVHVLRFRVLGIQTSDCKSTRCLTCYIFTHDLLLDSWSASTRTEAKLRNVIWVSNRRVAIYLRNACPSNDVQRFHNCIAPILGHRTLTDACKNVWNGLLWLKLK